jgi:hypothetical protein
MSNSKPALLQQVIAFFVFAWSAGAWKALNLHAGDDLFASVIIGAFGIYGVWVAIGIFQGRAGAAAAFYKWALLDLIAFSVIEFSIEPVVSKAAAGCLLAAGGLVVLGFGLRASSE